MKEALRIALIVYSLGLLNSAWGQSTFVFGNPRNAPVFDALGQRLFGTQYSAMLYGGVSQDSLVQAFGQLNTPLAPAFFTSLIGDQAGYFLGNDTSGSIAYFREPSAVEGGPPLWVQVRAWDNRLGSTYEDVVARGIGGYGESGLLQLPGGCGACAPVGPPTELSGLQSFSLSPVVPEPSSALLLLVGLPLLVWRCRRKN